MHLPYASEESMVLSQLQLAYFYYLKLSLIFIKLQNYRICESQFKFFKVHKKEKVTTKITTTTTKIDKEVIKKASLIYLLGILRFQAPENQILPATIKISNFVL